MFNPVLFITFYFTVSVRDDFQDDLSLSVHLQPFVMYIVGRDSLCMMLILLHTQDFYYSTDHYIIYIVGVFILVLSKLVLMVYHNNINNIK